MSPVKIIRAGGAVVVRDAGDGREREVVLVYRRRYDDWTLPKGKVENGEPLPVTAVREVEEETGIRVRLEMPLDAVRYDVAAGGKSVRWWSGRVVSERHRPADDEIDEVAWLPVPQALERLSHDHDRATLEQALAQPATVPLVLVRHAKAMDRKDWSKTRRDSCRPLNSRGRKQALRLPSLLAAYGVQALVSSGSVRCVSTLKPYAEAYGLEIAQHVQLSEERGVDHPRAVARVVRAARAAALASQTPTAICVHRPVLPAILAALDLAPATLVTGEMIVAHLTLDGAVHAVERHRPEV